MSCTIETPLGAIMRIGTQAPPRTDLPAVKEVPATWPAAVLQKKSTEARLKMQHAIAVSRHQAIGGLPLVTQPEQQMRRPKQLKHVAGLYADDDVTAAQAGPVLPIKKLFPGSRRHELDQLQLALAGLPGPSDARRTALICAAAAATEGDAVLACYAIKRALVGLDLHAAVRKGVPPQNKVEHAAWCLASQLANSDTGFCLLQSLHYRHAGMGRAARVILQAGSFARHDAARTGGLPAGSLAARARQAACRMLTSGTLLSDAEKASIFAWEQGFRSDEQGSPLAELQERLAKFAYKSLPRARKSRLRSFLPRLLGNKKSPLSALGHSVQDGLDPGAERAPKDVERNQKRPDVVQEKLSSLIAKMGSSTRLRLADGSARGINTKGLSINLSNVLHLVGMPIGPRINLGYRGSRRAVLEIGRNTHCGEILIGTERATRRSCGVGAMFGYDLRAGPARVRCGVSVDAEVSDEQRRMAGVVVRFAQRNLSNGKSDGARVRGGMQAYMGFLFEEQKFAKAADPAAMFERLAEKFFDDADISLGWQDGNTRRRRRAGSVCGAVLAKITGTPLRIGPVVALTAEWSSVAQQVGDVAGGRMRSTVSRSGRGRQVSLGFGLCGKLSTESRAQPPQTPGVGMFSAGLPSCTIPLHVSGKASRVRLIRENGRLQSDRCMLDVEFASIDEYVATLQAERTRWLARLAKGRPGDPEATARAGRALDKHLANARRQARHNQVFIQRCNLRPAVAVAIDRHTEVINAIRACRYMNAAEQASLCAASEVTCRQLLADPSAWLPRELKVIEKQAVTCRRGLSLALQLGTESAAEGEHQINGLKPAQV
ncbi:MAG: hypothetical protein H7234_05665 [Herminiimonas sp.]|nr:hypothetical protein [Herminiimonas sp.]